MLKAVPASMPLLLTSSIPRVQEVEDAIRQELHLRPLQSIRVEPPQLTLTLVVLSQVPLFQGYPRMNLIHLDCEVILDPLHREVLPHGLKLVTDVRVVVL